jgi:hypothetical protein
MNKIQQLALILAAVSSAMIAGVSGELILLLPISAIWLSGFIVGEYS